ncbi:MAG: hypothetical protein QM733_21190 [Ilumatobacteraceae bacterium]
MLTEIADEGGWSEALWHYADLVNGATGPIGIELTPGGANSGLGCDRFG